MNMLSECKKALRRGSSPWIRCCTCDHMRYDHMRSHEWIRSWNVLDLHRECCPNKRDCRSPLATSAQEILSKYWCVVASRGLSVDSERGVEGSSKRTASPPLCLFIKRVWGHFLGLCGVRRYSPKRIHKWMVGSTPTHDSWLVAASDRDKHGREYIYRETFKRSFTNTFTHAVLRTPQDENTYPERSSDSGGCWRRSLWGFSTASPPPPCVCWTRRMLRGARPAHTGSTPSLDPPTGRCSEASSSCSGKEVLKDSMRRWYEPLFVIRYEKILFDILQIFETYLF